MLLDHSPFPLPGSYIEKELFLVVSSFLFLQSLQQGHRSKGRCGSARRNSTDPLVPTNTIGEHGNQQITQMDTAFH